MRMPRLSRPALMRTEPLACRLRICTNLLEIRLWDPGGTGQLHTLPNPLNLQPYRGQRPPRSSPLPQRPLPPVTRRPSVVAEPHRTLPLCRCEGFGYEFGGGTNQTSENGMNTVKHVDHAGKLPLNEPHALVKQIVNQFPGKVLAASAAYNAISNAPERRVRASIARGVQKARPGWCTRTHAKCSNAWPRNALWSGK